jgi:hypothetical protein
LEDQHEASGVRERQWFQQSVVDDAEDGRIGANAECQRKDCDDREAGVFG